DMIAISPDAKSIALYTKDATANSDRHLLALYNVADRKKARDVSSEQDIEGFSFSPDSKLLAVLKSRPGNEDSAREVLSLYNGVTGAPVIEPIIYTPRTTDDTGATSALPRP